MVRPLDHVAAWQAKVRAELAAADQLVNAPIMWSGSLTPAVALVKGEPGPAERAGGAAVSGDDGDAAAKALVALGIDGPVWCTVSRTGDHDEQEGVLLRLRQQLCAIDPALVIALDGVAAADLAAAFGIDALMVGEPVAHAGLILLAIDGLEASLGDETRKREVWRQLQGARRPPAYPKEERDARKHPAGSKLF